MPTEKPRYCITVDDEMLKEIDDFRFGNRYNSRSQATLELIRLGLQVLREQEEAKKAQKNKPSGGETEQEIIDKPVKIIGKVVELRGKF